MKTKSIFVHFIILWFLILPIQGMASEWSPKGSMQLWIAFGAGGSTDMLGRLIAAELEKDTGWNVVVENKPGGGGVAMLSKLMNEKPDGNIVGLGVNLPILINMVMRGDKLPFKIDSFDYIGTLAKGEVGLAARSDAPFNNFEEMLNHAKSKKLAVAYDAAPQQMIMTAVGHQAETKFKFIKQKSGAEVIQSLLGGHADVGCPAGAQIKYLESGDLKMLAVFNEVRHSSSPETPTLLEEGFNYHLDPYFYLVAPKGLPSDIKNALVKSFDKAINSKNVATAVYNSLQVKPNNIGPQETYKMMSEGVANMKNIVDAGK